MYRLLKISDFEKMCQLMIDLAVLESKTKSRNPICYGCGKIRMALHNNLDSASEINKESPVIEQHSPDEESMSKSIDNTLNHFNCDEPKRVAIYLRTLSNDSSLNDTFENQVNHYKKIMQEHTNWNLIDLYSDEVYVDGTLNHNNESFKKLFSDCKSGKIDLIITKSISRFCQSLTDCMKVVRELSKLPNPVCVIFENEDICIIGDN